MSVPSGQFPCVFPLVNFSVLCCGKPFRREWSVTACFQQCPQGPWLWTNTKGGSTPAMQHLRSRCRLFPCSFINEKHLSVYKEINSSLDILAGLGPVITQWGSGFSPFRAYFELTCDFYRGERLSAVGTSDIPLCEMPPSRTRAQNSSMLETTSLAG